MATLSVLKFNTPTGADMMLQTLQSAQRQELIRIEDAAIVRWPEGAKKPKTQQLANLAGAGALGGAFWGLLFGLLFFVPFFGMAVGAAFGALGGHFADAGISDNFIKDVKSQVTPGTSALFLLTSGGVQDRITEMVKGQQFEIISTNLSPEQEANLRASFAEG